ncbi:MAG: hypothetical protein AcusKO_51020 [Acuticoccus sp.]
MTVDLTAILSPPDAPSPVLHRYGAPSWPVLERESADLATCLGDRLLDHVAPDGPRLADLRVLDFGAGAGVVTQVLRQRLTIPSDACDRDRTAMERLAERLPAVACRPHAQTPPLPYADATFDAIYADTTWLRLPPSAGLVWLQEIVRILKEGAVALIPICGPGGVRQFREAARPGWHAVTDADLTRTGALHMPFGPASARDGDDAFGRTAYTHGHILATWEPIVPVEAIYPQAIDALDLVVVRRRRPVSAPKKRQPRGPFRRLRSRLAKPG